MEQEERGAAWKKRGGVHEGEGCVQVRVGAHHALGVVSAFHVAVAGWMAVNWWRCWQTAWTALHRRGSRS